MHSTIASEGFNCNVNYLWYVLWRFYKPCILHYLVVVSFRYSAGLGDSELRYSRWSSFDNEIAYFFIICIDLTWSSWFDIIILTLVWCRYDQHVQQARPAWAARWVSVACYVQLCGAEGINFHSLIPFGDESRHMSRLIWESMKHCSQLGHSATTSH